MTEVSEIWEHQNTAKLLFSKHCQQERAWTSAAASTCHRSSLRDSAGLWQCSDPLLGLSFLCLHPPAPSCPFPSVTLTLQLCPIPVPAPCCSSGPFRDKLSLNQGSSSCLERGRALPWSTVKQLQNREAPRLPKPHSCTTGWVFCLWVIGLGAKEENYYSVVSHCSCWPLLVHLWFVFVFACSLTSVSGFTARAVSCRQHLSLLLSGVWDSSKSINPRL